MRASPSRSVPYATRIAIRGSAPVSTLIERCLQQIGDLVGIEQRVRCGDEASRERYELALDRRRAERHLGEEEAERRQECQQHDDEPDRDQRVGVDPFVAFGRHHLLDEHREDPILVEGQVLVDLAVAPEIDGHIPGPLLDEGVGLGAAPPQEPVGDVVIVDVEPEDLLAFERVGLAIGVPVDRHHDACGRDRPGRDGRDRPLGHDRPGDRLARRHADSGEDAERERADHGGDRERSHGRPTPPRHEPDHHDDNGAGDQSDDSADDPWNRGVAHGRRRSRAAEHRSGPYAEPETDRDDCRGDECRIAMTTRSRLRTVRLGRRHGGDANGSSTPREAVTEQRRESPDGTDVR